MSHNTAPFEEYAMLYISVDQTDDQLIQKYKTHIESHNRKVTTSIYPDSGFDLFIPDNVTFKESY